MWGQVTRHTLLQVNPYISTSTLLSFVSVCRNRSQIHDTSCCLSTLTSQQVLWHLCLGLKEQVTNTRHTLLLVSPYISRSTLTYLYWFAGTGQHTLLLVNPYISTSTLAPLSWFEETGHKYKIHPTDSQTFYLNKYSGIFGLSLAKLGHIYKIHTTACQSSYLNEYLASFPWFVGTGHKYKIHPTYCLSTLISQQVLWHLWPGFHINKCKIHPTLYVATGLTSLELTDGLRLPYDLELDRGRFIFPRDSEDPARFRVLAMSGVDCKAK